MSLLGKLLQFARSRGGGGGDEPPPIDPAVSDLVRAYVAAASRGGGWVHVDPSTHPEGRAILDDLEPAGLAQALLATGEAFDVLLVSWRGKFSFSGGDMAPKYALEGLYSRLLRKNPPLSDDETAWLLHRAATANDPWRARPLEGLLGFVARAAAKQPLSPLLRARLDALRRAHASLTPDAATRKLHQRIDALLHGPAPLELAAEPWVELAEADLAAIDGDARAAWDALIAHAAAASGSKPSQRWLDGMSARIVAVSAERFADRRAAWLAAAASPATFALGEKIPHDNDACLKGLAWSASLAGDAAMARTVGDLAETCFKKVPGIGALRPAVANACVASLSLMTTREAATELSRLKTRAKKPSAQKIVDRALARAAEQAGMTPEDLEEVSVPPFGLDPAGCLRETLGRFTAELRVLGRDVDLRFVRDDGKCVASVPAEVKRDHPEELRRLKATAKDIERLLPALRDRLEASYVRSRSWTVGTWRERWLDHPLAGTLARRLIWTIAQDGDRRLVASLDGRLVDVEGHAARELSGQETVTLWHPIESDAATVLAWREWLFARGVTQPFKQAHREIYAVTDAERATGTYSNRFAAHVLRQHQLAAICVQRGWTYHLQGSFDGGNAPTLRLPRHDLTVEFWVESPGQGPTSDAGIFLEVISDQVRLTDLGRGPRRVDDIPPMVFSEVMRDVDLFVGVTSIGTDPHWTDGGAGHRDYWNAHAFGELAEAAKIRKEVLERLLPRLAIASRCGIEGRYLNVKGTRGAYKIHIGTGNVLMAPNDAYLCIVPDRSDRSEGRVMLPFEGDTMLSIVLSKAFLLAADDKISDPSILSQMSKR